jgi:hypothetical protein
MVGEVIGAVGNTAICETAEVYPSALCHDEGRQQRKPRWIFCPTGNEDREYKQVDNRSIILYNAPCLFGDMAA